MALKNKEVLRYIDFLESSYESSEQYCQPARYKDFKLYDGISDSPMSLEFIEDNLINPDHKVIGVSETGAGMNVYANKEEIVLCFRGIEAEKGLADFIAAINLGVNQWNEIDDYVMDIVANAIERYPDAMLVFTGHSLGGALAEYAAYTHIQRTHNDPSYPRSKGVRLLTVNGFGGVPGLKVLNGRYDPSLLARGGCEVIHFVKAEDIIPRLSKHVNGYVYQLAKDEELGLIGAHKLSELREILEKKCNNKIVGTEHEIEYFEGRLMKMVTKAAKKTASMGMMS